MVHGTTDIIEKMLPVLGTLKGGITEYIFIEMIHSGNLPEVYFHGEPVFGKADT
jgi:hypothetical protein